MLLTISLFVLASSTTISAACVDADPVRCIAWSKNNLCNSEKYTAAEIKKYCAATCNKCCEDNDHRCAMWKSKEFCTGQTYPMAEVKAKCSKTCGLCI